MLKNTISILIILLLTISNISAQELKGKFADWSFFSTKFGSKTICYMVSLPVKQEGNYEKRGEPYLLVINSEDNIDEIAISSGYFYKKGSQVELSFGLEKFNAFTHRNLAWANNKTGDINITKAMRFNLDVIILGLNEKNQYSRDTYSLIGFNQAYDTMKRACNGLVITY